MKSYTERNVGGSVLAESGLGAELVGWKPLFGGVSASVFKLSYIDLKGQRCDAVTRCHGDVDYARNPHIAADEFSCVAALFERGFAVPKPLYLGATATVLGRPFAIYEYVEGQVADVVDGAGDLARRIPVMARWLSALHSVDFESLNLVVSAGNQLRPRQALSGSAKPADVEIYEPQVRELLGRFPEPSHSGPVGRSVLLHGDYWNGNLLWQGQELVAVIDWEDFGVGPAFADLSCARLELLWALGESDGESGVERFTRYYLEASGWADEEGVGAMLAWWDLCAVLPFAHTLAAISDSPSPKGAERLRKRRQLAGFVERAAARLGRPLNLDKPAQAVKKSSF